MPTLPSGIRHSYEQFNQKLGRLDREALDVMGSKWKKILEDELEQPFRELADELLAKKRLGFVITEAEAVKLYRYSNAIEQISDKLFQYGDDISDDLRVFLWNAAELGNDYMTTMAAMGSEFLQMRLETDMLPDSALRNIVAVLQEDQPLEQLLKRAYPMSVGGMTDELVRGVGLGLNPRQVARRMQRQGLSKGLDHIMLVTRDQMLRAQRQVVTEGYRKSPNIIGYQRMAAKSRRTCLACLSLDGKIWPKEKDIAIHPQDRCSLFPIFRGAATWDFETGEQWFNKQPEAVQRQMMGRAKFEAFKAGEFEFGQLATVTNHPIWGPSLNVTPLKTLRNGGGGFNPLEEDVTASVKPRKKRTDPDEIRAIPRNERTGEETRILLEDAREKAGETVNKELNEYMREIDRLDTEIDFLNTKKEIAWNRYVGNDDSANEPGIHISLVREYQRLSQEAFDEYHELAKQQNRLRAALVEVKFDKADLSKRYDQLIREGAIFHTEGAKIKVNQITRGVAKKNRANWDEGIEDFSRMIGPGKIDGEEVTMRIIRSTEEQRAFYREGERAVYLSKYESKQTIVHELTHFWDYQTDGYNKDRAVEFFNQRTAGQKFIDLYGNGEESGKPDEFFDKYCGKLYQDWLSKDIHMPDRQGLDGALNAWQFPIGFDGDIDPSWVRETELISQGVEKMYFDPIGFAQMDPDYFDFIWELIR